MYTTVQSYATHLANLLVELMKKGKTQVYIIYKLCMVHK